MNNRQKFGLFLLTVPFIIMCILLTFKLGLFKALLITFGGPLTFISLYFGLQFLIGKHEA